MGSEAGSALVAAIEAVAEVVRKAESVRIAPDRLARLAVALDKVATVTRTQGHASVERALDAIAREMIAPVDPSTLTWNAFRFFEVEDAETSWTKWLAALLSPENGGAVSQLAWQSLCDAVTTQHCELTATVNEEREVLAHLGTWTAARDSSLLPGSVDREVHGDELGRPDIVIDAPGLFVVLENKLDAGWHDGEVPQAVKYRDFGLQRCTGKQLGLVLLTKKDTFEMGPHTNWIRILYRDFARAMRRNLRRALTSDTSTEMVMGFVPVLLTVAAIEQDLLGIDIQQTFATARNRSWRAMGSLNEILTYLHQERE